jgi:hypothetical protein
VPVVTLVAQMAAGISLGVAMTFLRLRLLIGLAFESAHAAVPVAVCRVILQEHQVPGIARVVAMMVVVLCVHCDADWHAGDNEGLGEGRGYRQCGKQAKGQGREFFHMFSLSGQR